MPWEVVQRRIGKAGPLHRRQARQREWDRKYGEGNWEVGYVLGGIFVSRDDALETIYFRSYEEHFRTHPADLDELIRTAKVLRNPHAEATTGVDLQVPAIQDYLTRNGLTLEGEDVVDVGSWQGQASHAISIRVSPLQIRSAIDPGMTLEQFWQDRKCLAIWVEEQE